MENNKLEKGNSGLAVEYTNFLQEILSKIQSARYEMLKTVSKQTLLLYWDIGKSVSEKVRNADWGQSVVEQLSKDLRTEFPGVRGFSARNIWRMKNFYEFYFDTLILPPVGAELSTNTKSISYNSADAIAELQIAEYEKLQPVATEIETITETTNSAPMGAELPTNTKSTHYNSATAVAELEKLQPPAAELLPP
ncbi:MAG: DUF1016 N-terminal domain-containing protein, partial [Paludibacter sp.]|nr:DUF1016 N-terminal domain-containing protein [Paludibacter sp.]